MLTGHSIESMASGTLSTVLAQLQPQPKSIFSYKEQKREMFLFLYLLTHIFFTHRRTWISFWKKIYLQGQFTAVWLASERKEKLEIQCVVSKCHDSIQEQQILFIVIGVMVLANIPVIIHMIDRILFYCGRKLNSFSCKVGS